MATPRTPSVPFLRRPARLLAVLTAALLGALLLAPPPADAAVRELRNGDSGRAVAALQEQLLDLGYWLDGADGEFGPHTAQAVLALQKAAGIDRDGVVGPDTRAALADGVRPSATSSGDALEIDLERQLLLVVSGGEVEYTLNTSTGSGRPYLGSDGSERIAVTPTGTYTVFRQVSGWDPGPYGALYAPMYFNGGIAVHGYPSVPAQPASHGCARVSLSAMDWLREEGHIAVGTTVVVR
ncbi:L,D-transpeptidase family protein [Nocardiopsis changdeensis]|uniref:Murein L,D-transpeptidase n=1 Tax=Nocardiopsis changdeensis TaxID=2831969 RepID=A0ABX8BKR4_9ACTN|nr:MULTISPECIES: L,D-transpeptidase family protein [Nocardiopsis]QUX22691.1 murein L,D-transpeptidase [Nocardiopsis changdeensis]QYX38634.1 L,D-transpeptidase family protein [Nocardiopsis sp. MT53]